MILTTFAMGVTASRMADKAVGYNPKDLPGVILAGLVCVTVYAEIFSLFSGVGIVANVLLILFSVAVLVYLVLSKRSDKYSRYILDLFFSCSGKEIVLTVIIFAIMAYGTSHGLMHYDTGLYHAQAIRWIEEYGCVSGLANLHTRLGYNSSAFVLNALYSMAFTGNSYHVTGGFCALLLAVECVVTPVKEHKKVISTASFARAMGLYYLLMIFDEMVSPASDYYMVTLAFILVIRWLDITDVSYATIKTDSKPENNETENKEAEVTAGLCMLALLACFIVTVKLSGAMLVLLAILPGYRLIKDHKISGFISCIVSGAVIIFPFLIRNVILSGWILYPSTALGVFDVPWRIPKDTAAYDYKEIQVYGRGYTDVSRYSEPVWIWFKDWFLGQSLTDRVLIAAAVVGVIYFVIKCMTKAKKKNILITAVCCICFLFWMLTSPLMRYGCLYVYLCDALIWGALAVDISRNRSYVRGIIYVFLIALMAYKSLMFAGEAVRAYRRDTWVIQQGYEEYETYPYEIYKADSDEGIMFYAPVSGDRTGYEPFPSSPWQMDDSVVLKGDSLKDGFLPVD